MEARLELVALELGVTWGTFIVMNCVGQNRYLYKGALQRLQGRQRFAHWTSQLNLTLCSCGQCPCSIRIDLPTLLSQSVLVE